MNRDSLLGLLALPATPHARNVEPSREEWRLLSPYTFRATINTLSAAGRPGEHWLETFAAGSVPTNGFDAQITGLPQDALDKRVTPRRNWDIPSVTIAEQAATAPN